MGTLRVRNQAQKILFEKELRGQISDGHWENASPTDHWIVWSEANVVIDPSNPGRDFWARKANYYLDDPVLLDCVGDRMLEDVRAELGEHYSFQDMKKDLRDLRKIFKGQAVPA